MPDLMTGRSITRLLDAIDEAVESTKSMRRRALPILEALQARGFDVVEMAEGPVERQTMLPFGAEGDAP